MPSKVTVEIIKDRESAPRHIRLEPEQCKLLYGPICLEKALTVVCKNENTVSRATAQSENSSLLLQEEAFQAFINKIAQACDNRRGGDTVTAVTILADPEGPKYVFASNRRDERELDEAKKFLEGLLDLIGRNPEKLKPKPLLKRALWRLLRFHVPRVGVYLNELSSALDNCIDDCLRKGETHESPIVQELRRFKGLTSFDRDFVTSEHTQNKFLSDCESLIKAVHANKGTKLDIAIQDKAKDGELVTSEPWCDLRHYLGRFHSYRMAAEIIVNAATRWPSLFHCTVQALPSSRPHPRPLAKLQLTATEIVQQIAPELDLADYQTEIDHFNTLGLDNQLQKHLKSKTFRPIVHCEILLHDHLLRAGLTHERDFWNGWKYIGTSKPACRLCDYYFANHRDKIQIRSSHRNLYPAWRLPDVRKDQGQAALDARNAMVSKIASLVEQDAFRTLRHKFPSWKKQDSNTYSAMPEYLQRQYTDTDCASDLTSRASRISLGSSSRTSPSEVGVYDSETSNSAGRREDDDDDDEGDWEDEDEEHEGGTNI